MNTRNHGGRRPGSGGKRGSIYAPTRRKQALQAQWEAAVALRFADIIEAQIRAAIGTSVVLATDTAGTWVHHPDPDATTLARVQAGDGAYRLTTVAPNHALLKQIFDRLLGRPCAALEVEIPALPQVSDAELAAPLAALLRRWQVAHG
ncbi:MAG: hypothetical protein O3A25_18960 [Acidobacteria bacterium]|nr:hypothetical protein [Acidobacteriota bacterium]